MAFLFLLYLFGDSPWEKSNKIKQENVGYIHILRNFSNEFDDLKHENR